MPLYFHPLSRLLRTTSAIVDRLHNGVDRTGVSLSMASTTMVHREPLLTAGFSELAPKTVTERDFLLTAPLTSLFLIDLSRILEIDKSFISLPIQTLGSLYNFYLAFC